MEKREYKIPNLENLRRDLRAHYSAQKALICERHPTGDIMDQYDREHPGLNSYQLKAAQFEVLAEHMKTVILDDSPFFYVNDLCRGPQAGIPYYSGGGWLFMRNKHLCRDIDPDRYALYEAMKSSLMFAGNEAMYFDDMHYCFPIANIVKKGLKFYYDKAVAALETAENDEQRDFLMSAMAGFKAAKRIAERFGEAAAERLPQLSDPRQKKFMEMIIDASKRVPWEGCKHFYEGLNVMWFCRDVLGEIDGIGNSHLGRPDYMLIDMYREDIASGYMTEDEAYDLVSRFLMHGDCEYDHDSMALYQNDHELEMGYVLGGCDPQGNPVYNEITKMFIHAHRAQQLVYPKVHYRAGSYSPDEYMEEIAYDYVIGRSVAGIANDDAIIPFLTCRGVPVEIARDYVNYGCWGFTVECKSNSAGGSFVHTLSVMEQTIYGTNKALDKVGLAFNPIDDAQSFDEVYNTFYDNLIRALRTRVKIMVGQHPEVAAKVNPIPIFTGCMDGGIDRKIDQPRCVGLGFNIAEIANVVDSLLAIKSICFDQKLMSVKEFLDIVRNNWEGHEDLRQSLRKCPHYGDESKESMELANKIIEGIKVDASGDERQCGMSLLIYQEFRFQGPVIRATPDGRKNGDVVALGVNPTRIHEGTLPAILNSATTFNPETVSTFSINLQMPAAKMTLERMTAILKTAVQMKMKHIQVNCVDLETLLDAQKHPEKHQDLVVRVVGFSAKFVSLSPEWQEEFINRVRYEA